MRSAGMRGVADENDAAPMPGSRHQNGFHGPINHRLWIRNLISQACHDAAILTQSSPQQLMHLVLWHSGIARFHGDEKYIHEAVGQGDKPRLALCAVEYVAPHHVARPLKVVPPNNFTRELRLEVQSKQSAANLRIGAIGRDHQVVSPATAVGELDAYAGRSVFCPIDRDSQPHGGSLLERSLRENLVQYRPRDAVDRRITLPGDVFTLYVGEPVTLRIADAPSRKPEAICDA